MSVPVEEAESNYGWGPADLSSWFSPCPSLEYLLRRSGVRAGKTRKLLVGGLIAGTGCHQGRSHNHTYESETDKHIVHHGKFSKDGS